MPPPSDSRSPGGPADRGAVRMTVSAVISTKDRPAELGRLLRSLASQERRPEEVLVIDAACDPAVETIVAGHRGDFARVAYRALRCSLPAARNLGVRESSGEAVVFLDDDLVLDPGFIREIVIPLERDPAVAGVTGDVADHSRDAGRLKRLFQWLFLLPMAGDGRFRLSGHPTTPHGLAAERAVEFVPGGLTAWRRAVFREFSFDEGLPGLGVNEDVDFSWRVSRRWRNWYTPRARVTHLRPDLSREATLEYLRQELASALRLYRKNLAPHPGRAAALAWSLAGLVVRFSFRRWLR